MKVSRTTVSTHKGDHRPARPLTTSARFEPPRRPHANAARRIGHAQPSRAPHAPCVRFYRSDGAPPWSAARPYPFHDYILGGRIGTREVDRILMQRSALIEAYNVVGITEGSVTWATLVNHRHPAARAVWRLSCPDSPADAS